MALTQTITPQTPYKAPAVLPTIRRPKTTKKRKLAGPSIVSIYTSLFPTAGSTRIDSFHDFLKINSILRSPTLRNEFEDVAQKLEDIKLENSVADWDGYGALPVDKNAIEEAKAFLGLLSIDLHAPFVSPNPKGSVTLEWRNSDKKLFVVDLSGRGTLQFVSLYGKDRNLRGKLPFSTQIPYQITELISLYFSA